MEASTGGGVMSLGSVNLNLIPTLRALLQEQSVTRAAEVLHVSQPTVSQALARLRELYRDPLLLQVGRTMRLTPLARQLIGPVEAVCNALAAALPYPGFDPARSERVFTLGGTDDYGPTVLGPRIVRALAGVAPAATMSFVDPPLELDTPRRLGDIDVLLFPGPLVARVSRPGTRSLRLFEDQFVYAVGPDHPLAELKTVTDADLAGHHHVLNTFMDTPAARAMTDVFGLADPALRSTGRPRRVAARVEHFAVVPLLALATGSVALMPRRLFEQVEQPLGLRMVGRPGPAFDICLLWDPAHDTDPAHRWFVELLRATFADERAQIEPTVLLSQ